MTGKLHGLILRGWSQLGEQGVRQLVAAVAASRWLSGLDPRAEWFMRGCSPAWALRHAEEILSGERQYDRRTSRDQWQWPMRRQEWERHALDPEYRQYLEQHAALLGLDASWWPSYATWLQRRTEPDYQQWLEFSKQLGSEIEWGEWLEVYRPGLPAKEVA